MSNNVILLLRLSLNNNAQEEVNLNVELCMTPKMSSNVPLLMKSNAKQYGKMFVQVETMEAMEEAKGKLSL